ncbi:hypothetical protein ACH5RR_011914, partial [Cinchona calisaya]
APLHQSAASLSSSGEKVGYLTIQPSKVQYKLPDSIGAMVSVDEDTDDEKSDTTTSDKDQTYTQSSDSYSTKGEEIWFRSEAAGSLCTTGIGSFKETEAAKQAKKDEIENHFKAIQEAYEVVIDPTRRRLYDSTDEFDDEIPTDCGPQDFFKVFGPAFLRNGRCFKSWREFPHADEFDLEQAESRDHRGRRERQNAMLTEKARKEESARIRALVDNAYRRDPRILRRKEEEKAEKEEAARIDEEERRRKEVEEKKAAEAALHQKKVREKEKKLFRKERTRLQTLLVSILSRHLFDLTEEDVEKLCMSLDMENLRNLCDKIEGTGEMEGVKILKDALGHSHNSKDEKEDVRSPLQNGALGANGQFPLVEEILKATKTVLLQKPDSAKAFDSFLEKRKPTPSIGSPFTTREEVDGVSKGNAPNCDDGMADTLHEPSSQTANLQSSNFVTTENGVASCGDQDVWSAVQERALVQALKTFPKETN